MEYALCGQNEIKLLPFLNFQVLSLVLAVLSLIDVIRRVHEARNGAPLYGVFIMAYTLRFSTMVRWMVYL